MKAIHHSRILTHRIFTTLGLCAAVMLSGTTFADDEVKDDAVDVPEVLELYPGDEADACVPGKLQIRITVNNVYKQGILKLELYAEEDGFLNKKGRLRAIRVPAENGPQMVCINVPGPGSYAVAGYHDEDGDRKLDKKWNFMPKEPYALSNNPEIETLRIPKFSEAQFDVGVSGTDIVINLVDLQKKKKDKDDD